MIILLKEYRKLRALNFAEIAVTVFIVIAVSFILLAKIFGVSQESQVIYNWKETLAATKYSYGVLLLTQRDKLKEFVQTEGTMRNSNVLNLFRTTLKVDSISAVNEKRSLKSYKYRFLNGRKVPKDSKYYVQDFVYSPDGNIMAGLNWMNPNCMDTDELCGIMVFDMNGVKLPNRFGLDVFGVNIYNDRLEPFGTGLSYRENQLNCRRLETGVTCSKFYLMGGQFFK